VLNSSPLQTAAARAALEDGLDRLTKAQAIVADRERRFAVIEQKYDVRNRRI